MSEKIKVYNRAKFDVGVRTITGFEYNIRPGSFIPLEVMDVEKLAAETKLFSSGILRVDENHREIEPDIGVIAEDNPNFMTDDDMHKILEKKGAVGTKELKALLEEAKTPFLKQRIFDMAKDLDLPASKMKIIEEAIPELFMIEE